MFPGSSTTTAQKLWLHANPDGDSGLPVIPLVSFADDFLPSLSSRGDANHDLPVELAQPR